MRNFDRLAGLLKRTTGDIKVGGQSDKEKLYLAPSIVAKIALNGICCLLLISDI